MRQTRRTACVRACIWAAALVIVVADMTARTARAQAGGGPPPQPAVSLPPRDILSADSATGASGANRPVAPESGREIRRPSESGATVLKKTSSTQPATGSSGDERTINRQAAAKGFWRMSDFLPLAIVLVLVLAAAWLVKRYLPARRLITGAGVLEIVARMPLSSRQSLVLVRMGRQMILVGVTPERVNPVCLVDNPEQVAELVGRLAAQTPGSSSGFGRSLDDQVEEFDERADGEAPFQAAGGVRGLLEKVRRLSRSEV